MAENTGNPMSAGKQSKQSLMLRQAQSATSGDKKSEKGSKKNSIAPVQKPPQAQEKEKEFTEVFSWGNDKSGQLGLG